MPSRKRTPFKFYHSYCGAEYREAGGHKYLWVDGRSPRADTELKRRLEMVMIKRPRSVIWKDTPAKTRQVIRLDVGGTDETDNLRSLAADETHLMRALEKVLPLKTSAICDAIIEEISVGEKIVVWVLTRESVEIMTSALEEISSSPGIRNVVKEQKTELWSTHGEAPLKTRRDIAADFRNHKGAACLITTMDSMPEGVSLKGALTEIFAQMHYVPGTMLQAENRPYGPDVRGLHILYFQARGTVDERVEALTLPRLITMEKLVAESDAAEVTSQFDQKIDIKDVWAKMFASMPDGDVLIPGGVREEVNNGDE